MRGCFVTGTDTGVGKTVLAAAIAAALRARGLEVTRAQAGRDRARRAARPALAARPRAARRRRRLQRRTRSRGSATGRPSRRISRPSWRAESLDPQALIAASGGATGATNDGFLVVEGVGGLLVPLTGEFSVRDLAA